jgi:hypothetical protein
VKLKLLTKIAAPLAAIGLIFVNAGVAQADGYPYAATQTGFCNADLYVDNNHYDSGHDYVEGNFWADSGILTQHCYGWVERNKGSGWSKISPAFVTDDGDYYDHSIWYYDGGGWLARVCTYYSYWSFGQWHDSATKCGKGY